MKNISELTPNAVWTIFEEITRVPRPSKKEGKIIAYLEDFATKHGLKYRKDEVGNVVILKEATKGYESHPTVILQSHVDMVCEKRADVKIDFENDPIEAYIDGENVRARGTTLGADDGIGMAAALALLIDKEAAHPALEALFTIDEETGLTGAFNLKEGMLEGTKLINMDSEEEGEFTIGCAGGVDTLGYLPYKAENSPTEYAWFKVGVEGLLGGHSGEDIIKGRGNANKILVRALLSGGSNDFGVRLAKIDGGNLRNAIPRDAYAIVGVKSDKAAYFTEWITKFDAQIKGELTFTDKGVKVSAEITEQPTKVIDLATQRNLFALVEGLPNGVLAMSFAVKGLVETSSNLASLKMDDNQIVITTSQRSSVESAKHDTALSIESVMSLAGCRVEHSDGYPGWAPNPNSELLAKAADVYERLFGKKPIIKAIHAGLECGLFLEKYPSLDMVSFGPTLEGVHSPDERLEIPTVEKFWKLLVELVKNI